MSTAVALSEREAGDIIRRIINLEDGVKDLRSEVKTMDGKVDDIAARIDTTFARLDGGWRVLVFLSGLAGTIGAGLTFLAVKMWPFLLGTLPKV
jgi:hypothetical protein